MPRRVLSLSHEVLVELFRNCGELAPTLLQRCAGIPLDHDRAEQGSIDLSQVIPTEYRADVVIVLRDQRNAVVAAVIVEVQLHVDRIKARTWPVYITALHARFDCPVVLLVLTDDRKVARWALGPFALGHPKFSLEPVVIEFDALPWITDPADAQRLPELAVLSTMAHPELDVAAAAISALSGLPENLMRLYLDLILAAVSPSVKKTLETRMLQGYVYQSEFARKYYSQGLEEGRERGLEEGRGQGLELGLQRAVFALLRTKLDVVTTEDEAAIAAVAAEPALTELIGALGRTTSAEEARAVLTAARTSK